MREQAKLAREKLVDSGASKSTIAAADLQAQKAELEVLNTARDQAKKNQDADTKAFQMAEGASVNFERTGGAKLLTIDDKIKAAAKLVEDVETAMQGKTVQRNAGFNYVAGMGMVEQFTESAAGPNDKMDIKGSGKVSLEEARQKFNDLSDEYNRLKKVQAEIQDLLESKKKLTQQDVEDYKHLTKEAGDLQAKITAQTQAATTPEKIQQRYEHGTLTDLQKIGGGTQPSVLVDIGRAQLGELRALHHTIKQHQSQRGGYQHEGSH